jgi:thiosulfate/3-mercaptopyruvate sulfurtransferase
MKKYIKSIILPLMILLFLLPVSTGAREIEPIVHSDWLEANLANPNLIILDIRHVEEYREGHIPGAVNSFYGGWAYKKGELYSEIPEPDDLEDLIGYLGIGLTSWVVVVGKTDTPRDCYQSTRVVCTLQYAGIESVALLDGGINQWIKHQKPLSTAPVTMNSKLFKGKFNKEKFADKDFILSRMGKIILLDVREASYFKGEKKMDCIARPGRLPGAFNLPTSCAYNKDGTFKTKEELSNLAESPAGKDKTKTIVTYCDIGQCCPTWMYILKEVLGYQDVRMYDGAMQEWMQDPSRPTER